MLFLDRMLYSAFLTKLRESSHRVHFLFDPLKALLRTIFNLQRPKVLIITTLAAFIFASHTTAFHFFLI